MKRTRRIEVIRYSRRVTVIQGESATGYATAEAGDLILNALEDIAPTPERVNCDGSTPDDAVADHPLGRRSFFGLRELLRLGRRT